MKNTLTKSTESELAESNRRAIGLGQNIMETGMYFAQMVDKNPNHLRELAEFNPRLGLSSLENLVRIGRGLLLPDLATSERPGFVMLARCDIAQQNLFIEQPLDLLLPNGDVLAVAAANLSYDQARQVFNRGSIRDIAAQRAFLEDKKRKSSAARECFAYKIRGKNISFNQPFRTIPIKILGLIAQDLGLKYDASRKKL